MGELALVVDVEGTPVWRAMECRSLDLRLREQWSDRPLCVEVSASVTWNFGTLVDDFVDFGWFRWFGVMYGSLKLKAQYSGRGELTDRTKARVWQISWFWFISCQYLVK